MLRWRTVSLAPGSADASSLYVLPSNISASCTAPLYGGECAMAWQSDKIFTGET